MQLDELNAKNKKKQESFHEENPRKTRGKGKFQEALAALKPNRRTGSDKQPKQPATSGRRKRGLKKASPALSASSSHLVSRCNFL